jgi:acyl-CoA reductase-like NAD-dependent aldehyde dehydrogenase
MALAAVVLLLGGFAYTQSRPPTPSDYHRTLVQVAESAHDAVRTGWLTGREQLSGRVFGTFVMAAFDDAGGAIAGAGKKFAAAVPPDGRSARLRDRLNPLLQEAVRDLGDAARADNDDVLRAAVDALGRLADRLDTFIEDLR